MSCGDTDTVDGTTQDAGKLTPGEQSEQDARSPVPLFPATQVLQSDSASCSASAEALSERYVPATQAVHPVVASPEAYVPLPQTAQLD